MIGYPLARRSSSCMHTILESGRPRPFGRSHAYIDLMRGFAHRDPGYPREAGTLKRATEAEEERGSVKEGSGLFRSVGRLGLRRGSVPVCAARRRAGQPSG